MNLSFINKLPTPVYHWLRSIRYGRPPLGMANLGSLGRVKPISKDFGFDRGLPVDRYYIENFLACHANDIQGHVLEIKEPLYTYKFGRDRITKSDVLHVEPGNPKATIVADLTNADHLPSNTFDCIILTQTLQFIYDVPAAIKTLYRILKPGGILLLTVSGISQISSEDMERWGTCCCLNPELRGGQRVGHLPRWILHEAGRYTVLLYSLFLIYRRRIKTEDKAKVVAAVWGTKFIHLLAALAILN